MSFAFAHPEITDYSARQSDACAGKKGVYHRHPWGDGPIFATPKTTGSIAARFERGAGVNEMYGGGWKKYLVRELSKVPGGMAGLTLTDKGYTNRLEAALEAEA